MDAQALGNVIQVAVVIATVGASITALVIASKDRKHAADIARQDRADSARQLRLLSELDAARRLSILTARGGHTDDVIRKDMGAETLALVAYLGSERVPMMWERKVGKSDAELTEFVRNDKNEQFLRDSVEAEQAVQAIVRDIRGIESRS